MTSHDELLDSVAAYALGFLPAADAADVAAHLQTCDDCRREYDFLRPAVTAVAYSAQACADAAGGAAVVSPLLKARIMKRVRETERSSPRAWPAYGLAAACLALAVLTGIADLTLNSRLNALNDRLNRESVQNEAQQQTIADLAAPDSLRYPFTGGEVLAHGERLYIAMRGLAVLPAGRVYQAWTLAKGAKTVAPSVTFAPGSGGATVVRLPESPAGLVAVAVSVEPAGGSKQPTTKPMALVRI